MNVTETAINSGRSNVTKLTEWLEDYVNCRREYHNEDDFFDILEQTEHGDNADEEALFQDLATVLYRLEPVFRTLPLHERPIRYNRKVHNMDEIDEIRYTYGDSIVNDCLIIDGKCTDVHEFTEDEVVYHWEVQ